MQETYKNLLEDTLTLKQIPDAELITNYLKQSCPHGDPICLSFGETWTQSPDTLRNLIHPKKYTTGYQLSVYGLPKFRKVLQNYIIKDHNLPNNIEERGEFLVTATWSGTRSIMFDFGRMVYAAKRSEKNPVVISTGPSWDYTGVFEPIGFTMRYLLLEPQQHFRPSIDKFKQLIQEIDSAANECPGIVIINAQHNPTAVNWDEAIVREMIELAFNHGFHVLLDDAYYAVYSNTIKPTSALQILLNVLENADSKIAKRWIGVRSLGKQFNCNGFGVGSIAGHPETIERILYEFGLQHRLMYDGILQDAMAEWLMMAESKDYLKQKRIEYDQKRREIGHFLINRLGYPEESIHLGECTPYSLFAVPKIYSGISNGVATFKNNCFNRTGVLLAPGWPLLLGNQVPVSFNYIRLYAGAPLPLIISALERLEQAGIHYSMDKKL